MSSHSAREGTQTLERWAPGLFSLLRYRWVDFGPDMRAGLAVAAVAIPVGIAYAQLAGFRPEVGLYTSLFPLLAYAVFGSSRQTIVGPDAATCAVIAASVAPLAGTDAALYASLSGVLALMAGLICILASFLRLGALADFLSKPILVGLMNGIAITIILGQLGKMLGIAIASGGFVGTLTELASRIGETNLPSLALAATAFLIVGLSSRFTPSIPSAILAMALCALAVVLFRLEAAGVKTLGPVPAGLPSPTLPVVEPRFLADLLPDAAALALVSFTSLVFASRSFAAKNGYQVDADQDFLALGICNIVAATTRGFAVSGADSRTAMSDSAGGRTHAAGLAAAVVIALVLIFLTKPLSFVPVAALGAVLVVAGLSLIDAKGLRLIYRADPVEAGISAIATLGVVGLGVTKGVLVAVVLAILRFVQVVARPPVEVLGRVEGMPGFHSLGRHSEGAPLPGTLIFRFNGPLVFFNAGRFRTELLAAVDRSEPAVRTVILDLLPVTRIDVTGLFELKALAVLLRTRHIELIAAGRMTEWRNWLTRRGFDHSDVLLFPTLRQAVKAAVGSLDTADPDASQASQVDEP